MWLGVVGIVLLLAVLVNQTAVHWRSNIVDSDLFAYYGWCVAQGARPYLDVWDNKPPGIWWINAAAIRLAEPGAAADLLLGSTALLVTLAAFVGIARTAFHRSVLLPAALVGAVVLTHLHFECGSNRTETFVVTGETLAVLGYLRWLRSRRRGWLLLAGLAAGTAPLFKQSGLAAALAMAVHLAWTQWRGRSRGWTPWLVGGAALLVPAALAAAVLAWQGALGEAVFAVAKFNRVYFAIGDATWNHVGRAMRAYGPTLAPLSGLLALVALGLLGGGYVRLARGWKSAGTPARPGAGLFLLWGVLAVYLACVGPGRQGHHLMPAVPALALLTLYPLHLLAGRRGWPKCLTARPSAVCAVVVWSTVLGVSGAGSLAEASRCWRTKPHWYSLARSQPNECEQRAAVLLCLTRPTDTIYVWGWSPGTYRYTCRLPASRFATLEKSGQVRAYAQFIVDGAMADIRRHPPRAFVISAGDYGLVRGEPPSDFGAWVRTHYELVDTVAGMHILTRRGDLDNAAGPG
jgi:hypothetical protein